MNIPRLLYQLQELDLAIDAMREKSSRIEADLAMDPLAAERIAICKQQAELKALQHDLRENSTKVDDFTDRIKVLEDKLYSGRISIPKELTALQKDIELIRGHRVPFEDKSLELMETIETEENEIAAAEIALQRSKEKLEIHRRELSGQLKTLAVELSELDSRRAALLPEIPAEAQTQYQTLRRQKGKAIAKVEQGTCRGCGIAVTSAWLHRARNGEVVHCPSCNRILYLE